MSVSESSPDSSPEPKAGQNPGQGSGQTPATVPAPIVPLPPPPPKKCTRFLDTTQKNLRILTLVDNSGSTLKTDPDRLYRVSTMESFIKNYSRKSNFTYGFGYFADSARGFDAKLLEFATAPKTPFGTATGLSAALDKYSLIKMDGKTNFALAIGALKKIVAADVAANGEKWDYAVVFMSDGLPTDIKAPIDENLTNLVDDLQKAVPRERLTVSTVYFGPKDDTEAINHLVAMATAGDGQFVDTNAGTEVVISDLITVQGELCDTDF